MTLRILLTAIFVASSAFRAAADEAPPAGYSWQAFEEVGATFLRPDGWHFKSEPNGDGHAYFLTRENIDEIGFFKTGLSVNVLPRAGQDVLGNATESAYAARCANQGQLIDSWSLNVHVFHGFGCQIRAQPKPNILIRLHMLFVRNRNTDTLYVITFESPDAEWQQAWAVGRPILDSMGLDDAH